MHMIQALVGRLSDINVPLLTNGSLLISLNQGFALIPVDEDYCRYRGFDPDNAGTLDGFELLSTGFLHYLLDASHRQKIAYIETCYFGGLGVQGAVLFESRAIRLGPAVGEGGIINCVLRSLGVAKEDSDEFDALGLGRHRCNTDWLQAATAS